LRTLGTTHVRGLFRRFVPPFALLQKWAAGRERTSAKEIVLRVGPYLLTVATVALALYASLVAERYGARNLEFPIFLFAIASTIWYPGVVPAILAVVLSSLAVDYYFTEPRYTWAIHASDIPYFTAFVAFSVLVTGFSVVRRRAERALLESREQLRVEIGERQKREEDVRKLNRQLEKRTADLEASNKELEAFAYSISHDLRAPLRHMVGFAELLQSNAGSALGDTSRRYVTTILDAARKMGNLIDDLLAFSRIGRAETRESTFSLQQLVKEVVDEMPPDAAPRKVSWKIGALPDLYGDHAMLKVVFVNLIANALKFTRTRERAEIEIGSSFEDGQRVVVFVKDNGVGFEMKYYNKLFRVFQRLHRSEEFEGTGIGLAIVQRVIQRHHGTVWAEGAVNGGASFFFSVPLESKR
jgi:signal transduction histidine kinase